MSDEASKAPTALSLRPDERVQRALISTTSRLVGEFEQVGFLITHAWPDFSDRSPHRRMQEGPSSRNAYVLSIETPSYEKKVGAPLPNYGGLGNTFASLMSVLYGKRFDSHGLLQGTGLFHVPDLSQFDELTIHTLPQNSHKPRVDYPVELNLLQFARFSALLGDAVAEDFVTTFLAASKFYMRALQAVERDAEVAYLHLITAGELLSNFRPRRRDDLLDDEVKAVLARIEAASADGPELAGAVRHRLRQIKRRFINTIVGFVDEAFFAQSEMPGVWRGLRRETFHDRIAAAYDLRSRYVHTGISFGTWVAPSGHNFEVQVGEPVVGDKKLGTILYQAPTFVGLERILRYCLLRFAEANGVPVGVVITPPAPPGSSPPTSSPPASVT